MKKLLLLLMALLALTPPLRADWQKDYEKLRDEIAWEYSKTTQNGKFIAYYYDVDLTTREIGTELKQIELTDYENPGNNQYNITTKIVRLEWQPSDSKDVVEIIFNDEDVPESYIDATNKQKDVKVGAFFTTYGISIQPKTKFSVQTRFGGALEYFNLQVGTLLSNIGLIDGYFAYPDYVAPISNNNAGGDSEDKTHQIFSYGNTYSKQSATAYFRISAYSDKSRDYTYTLRNFNARNTSATGLCSFKLLSLRWIAGIPPTPLTPDIDFNVVNGYEDNNDIYYSKDVTIKAKFNTEETLTDSKLMMHISDNPENIDPENDLELTKSGDYWTCDAFTSSKYVQVYAYYPAIGTASPVISKQLHKLDNVVFDNLADAQVEANNNKLVTFSCPLLIEGIQNTQNNAKFMYVRDPQGNAIKFVNNSADIFFNESKHYKVGQEIPAYGVTGVYRHTEGWPQIEVYVGAGSDYRRYSADATYVMTDFDDYDPKRTTFGADDFNRHVVVSNLTWTGSESRFTDSEGNSLNAYGRFTDYQGVLGTLKEGKSYTVDGFIGQIKGEPTIFPTGYAPEVMIYAPNPIIGEKDADGWIDVNIISDDVTFTVNSDDFPSGTNLHKRVNGSNGTWSYQYSNSQTLGKDEFVFNDKGILEVVLSTTYKLVYGAEQKIRFHKREVTKEFATLAEFNTEFRDATDIPEPNTDDTRFYRFTGRAEVRAVTPKYLYLRDADCEEGKESISSLLLYNENGWQSAVTNLSGATGNEPEVGDILTNFALIPDHTQLGNLRGYATNFARTLRRAQDGSGIEPTPKTKEATEAFSDDDRMVRYIVKGATVARDDKGVYTISNMPGNPVLNIGDVFEVTGGWTTAWDPTKSFDIEGIVLRNGDAGYALAFYDFTAGESSPAMAVPTLEGVEDTDPTVGLSFATTAKVVLTLADAEATADIWYTTDGSDPLNNPDKRSKYTAPFEISATTTVKAYSAVAGAMPSAVVERTFTRTTSDRRYIINFLNQGHPGEMYNFTGTVAVAAIGKEYMFVRGAVGHYLPVKLTAEGASWTDKGYAVGNHLTGFMLGYHEEGAEGAVNRMGRVADAATLATWGAAVTPDAGETIDVANPETTSAISAANARRMVTVKGVHINRGAAKADAWTMTEANGEGATYALVPEVLGADMSAVTGEGQQFDVTGFVMYSADGALEMWPMSISRLTPAANVAITVDGKPAGATAEFTSSVKLEFSCPTPGAVIQYQFYNENSDTEPERWYTYEGRPVVIDESCRLHTRATAPGFAVGNHTHLNLVRLDQTAAPAISAVEGTESSTVTISAETGTVISWWTSEDATAKIYTAPITIEATTIVYATAKAEGKVESPVTHKLVKVAGSAAPSDKISGKVNISARLNEEGKPVVTITPADETLTPGSYTIYYTLEEGVVLTPENGTKYTGEFIMQESGLVTAILVESGKSAGEPCSLNVWAGVTGIDGISGAEGESEVRVDGDSIIAPQGSEVYDLSGRRVNPTGLTGGIYIVRIPGGKAIKVRI